ncbi:sigma-70 family RNA polymerase sigma factor [Clostridium tagluense]|nr:sigma-70 family RNA polymerase sigma factor [Clostridium tagluense]MCB2318027.1 sigma-70 family RNA polymerase sigma factor [Clostridium tagluense]MCB2327811.1 sigma-70 family RNA polymerase sigma factor [Clostridium tagluense]MCB2332458.1 sigma-70 family RNA polymerase sigma factor [Clostridium tagluense]MCB2337427.1 sigma-70 family RNA polymerase sigma factor [Clostridium tagluense]WAG53404.1 sigma-70 family RNA polymerase sigma factor [Clostridium tagluense]
MDDELCTLIKQSQNKNKDAATKIIEKFMPLIKKYATKLNYDGADTDLIISLIKLIKKLPIDKNKLFEKDKVIVSYIAISIKNEYIRLSQRYGKISKMEIICEDDIINNLQHYDENYSFIVEDLLKKLPALQNKIIKGIFLLNLKEVDLAVSLGISRQAVNSTKRRALKNLKKYLS